jgi:hypothetical protein
MLILITIKAPDLYMDLKVSPMELIPELHGHYQLTAW